ncbi:hypothetical protein ACOMHN_037980 [Nucella lapillus]
MAESEEDFGVQDNAITWQVIDGELTSSTPSMLLGTAMVTTDIGVSTVMVTNDLDMSTEQPYEEFSEVKAALLIDRIYIPAIVSVGVLGNFLCFVTLVFTSLRTTSTCVYMAAIAVLDSIILVLDFCVLIRGYTGHTEFYLRNDWTCGFHNFLFYFSIHYAVLLLLAITVDRFIVVKFPLKAQSLCTPKSAIKAIAALGLFSFGLNVQILFNRRLGPSGSFGDPLRCWYPDPEVNFCMRKIYTWIDASIYSFIPFISLFILNLLIIRQLRVSQKFSKQFTGRKTRKSPGANDMKIAIDTGSYNSEVYTSNTDLSTSNISTTVAGERTKEPGSISTISGRKTKENRDGEKDSRKKATTNTNITVMLLLVSFTFLLLTSPVVLVLLYKRYHWLPRTPAERARARLTHAFVDNLMYTNHAINFLLYCISGRRFRQELKRLLARFCCRW